MVISYVNANRPRLFRLTYIDKMIKTGLYPNSRSLAEDLEVSPRTISRDIEFIKYSLGAPLEYDSQKRGYYYAESEYSIGLLKLTEGELLALFFGHALLSKCRGTSYEKPVLNAFNKICLNLQETISIDFDQLSETIDFDLEPLRGEEKKVASYFTAISKAISQRRTLVLDYYAISKNLCKRRYVDPYQLRYYQGAWYLMGFCHLRQAIRIFALDRIRELQTTKSTFCWPRNFNASSYFQDAFQLFKGSEIYHIKIWFSPAQARWIRERKWHPTQEIEEAADGSLVLSMQTSGLFQVKRWVLSFGAEAKVLAPDKLIKEMKETLHAAYQIYL